MVDRSLLTTSDAVAVLEFSKFRGGSTLGSWMAGLWDLWVASKVDDGSFGSVLEMMMDGVG